VQIPAHARHAETKQAEGRRIRGGVFDVRRRQLSFLFVLALIPEIKGCKLEQIEKSKRNIDPGMTTLKKRK
jgi:hypothetical protein